MNLFPLRVILIASILLVAKVATVKAQSDGHDLYDIDSYEPMPSFFDTFPDVSGDSEIAPDSFERDTDDAFTFMRFYQDANQDSESAPVILEPYTDDVVTFMTSARSGNDAAFASSSANNQYHNVETHTKTYHIQNKDYAKGKAPKKVSKVIWSKSKGEHKKAY